jgi:isopentenyl-diphosphate delta-isomerase
LAEAGAPPDEIVSFDDEPLILVDEHDREIGYLSKAACHDGDGVLHRAFSIFIFNRHGKLLLQRRSAHKRLWPLFWSNSCCSHPRRGEAMDDAVRRRLLEELGMGGELHHLFSFTYHASFQDAGSERELCWVWVGLSDDPPRSNQTEVDELRWITPEALDQEMAAEPDRFTPWFVLEWPRIRDSYAEILGLAST